jgi:hypothetical protein
MEQQVVELSKNASRAKQQRKTQYWIHNIRKRNR